jgi:hypothetical protein
MQENSSNAELLPRKEPENDEKQRATHLTIKGEAEEYAV